MTDSKDNEVWRSSHGKGFVVKEDKSFVGGKYLMVGSIDSDNQKYFTDEGAKLEVCFSAKSVREHAGECEKLINKVHSIIKSLNIHMTRYYSELFE